MDESVMESLNEPEHAEVEESKEEAKAIHSELIPNDTGNIGCIRKPSDLISFVENNDHAVDEGVTLLLSGPLVLELDEDDD